MALGASKGPKYHPSTFVMLTFATLKLPCSIVFAQSNKAASCWSKISPNLCNLKPPSRIQNGKSNVAPVKRKTPKAPENGRMSNQQSRSLTFIFHNASLCPNQFYDPK